MEKTVQQAYDEYCNLVYALLLTNCPIDTGNMITHIRYNNTGTECHITIDTIPYNKAPSALKRRIKKYGKNAANREVEYAVYTEYPWVNRRGKNPNESWIRRNSIYVGATCVAPVVLCEIEV